MPVGMTVMDHLQSWAQPIFSGAESVLSTLSLPLGADGYGFLLLLVAIRVAVGFLPAPRADRSDRRIWRH